MKYTGQELQELFEQLPSGGWELKICHQGGSSWCEVQLFFCGSRVDFEIRTLGTPDPIAWSIREAVRCAKLTQERLDREATERDRATWTLDTGSLPEGFCP